MKRWKKLDEKRVELEMGIDLDNFMSPLNRNEEYAKVAKAIKIGKRYEPVFEYPALPDLRRRDIAAFGKSLDESDIIEALLKRWTENRLLEIEMAESHDAEVLDRCSRELFGFPSDDLLAKSKNNLETIPPDAGAPTGRILKAEECAELLREAMEDNGFDWEVRILPEMGIKACVDNIAREFCIRADASWRESVVKMIVVHEIGTHVLRASNGYLQPLTIFGTGLPGYQETEEGLAEYTEVKEDCFSPVVHRRISARVLAAKSASNGSFFDLFSEMTEFYKPDAAYDIALRAKMGISDTSKPGSYVKDYLYLHGLHKVERFFEQSSDKEKRLLYAGKIRIEDLPLVTRLVDDGYMSPPRHLPGFITG